MADLDPLKELVKETTKEIKVVGRFDGDPSKYEETRIIQIRGFGLKFQYFYIRSPFSTHALAFELPAACATSAAKYIIRAT